MLEIKGARRIGRRVWIVPKGDIVLPENSYIVLKKFRSVEKPHVSGDDVNVGSLSLVTYSDLPQSNVKLRKRLQRMMWYAPAIRIAKSTYLFAYVKKRMHPKIVTPGEIVMLIKSEGGKCFKLSKLRPLEDWMHKIIRNMFKEQLESRIKKIDKLIDMLMVRIASGSLDKRSAEKAYHEIKSFLGGVEVVSSVLRRSLRVNVDSGILQMKERLERVKGIIGDIEEYRRGDLLL